MRFLFSLLLVQSIFASGQSTTKKGFLFPGADLIDGSERTFIILCEIDTNLSVQANLKLLEADTLMPVSWPKRIGIDYRTLINEDPEGQPFRVNAVEVTLGDWIVTAHGPFIKSFEPCSIKFSGRYIVSGWNPPTSYYIHSLRVLNLPE